MRDCVITIVLIAFTLFSNTVGFHGYQTLNAAEKKKSIAAIYLYPDSFSAEKGREILKTAALTINNLKNHDYADAEARMLVPGYSKSKESIQEALRLYRKGKELYDNLEVDKAVKNFESAKELFEKQLDKTADFEFFSKVLLYLGASHTMIDEKGKAKGYFTTYLGINPKAVLDEAEFPPNIIEAFNRVKEDFEMMPNGSILFKSYPENALVFVDGKIAGVTPLRLDGVTAGIHYYRIHRTGYDDIAGLVDVGDKEESEIDKHLAPRVGAEFLPDLEKEFVSSFGSTEMLVKSMQSAEKFGVDRLAVFYISVERQNGAVKALLFDKERKSYKDSSLEIKFEEDSNQTDTGKVEGFIGKLFSDEIPFTLLTATSKVSGKPLEIEPEETNKDKKAAVAQKSIFTEWWFWAAVGACVVGGGVGAYMLTKDDGGKDSESKAVLKINFN